MSSFPCILEDYPGFVEPQGLSVKPILQALVLADYVYTDAPSGKKVIAGTFHTVNLRKFSQEQIQQSKGAVFAAPQMGSPWAYISLTDVVDNTEIDLQFVKTSERILLFHTALKIPCNDRLATIEVVLQLPHIAFFVKEAGVYSFDAMWKGEILGSHRITATELKSQEGGQSETQNGKKP